MQDVHRAAKPDGVDTSEGVAVVIGDDFEHAPSAVTFEQLRVGVRAALLRLTKGETQDPFHFERERTKVA